LLNIYCFAIVTVSATFGLGPLPSACVCLVQHWKQAHAQPLWGHKSGEQKRKRANSSAQRAADFINHQGQHLVAGRYQHDQHKKKVLIIPGKIGIEPFDSVQAGSSRSENGKSHSTLVEAVSKFKYPRQNKTMQIA